MEIYVIKDTADYFYGYTPDYLTAQEQCEVIRREVGRRVEIVPVEELDERSDK